MTGKKAEKYFKNEPGGHRVQRQPKNDKRGRTHTSTITVSVLPEKELTKVDIKKSDLEWKFCRGSGTGGQHRNVTDSAVHLTHIPTKMKVRVENERSQHLNKEVALNLLKLKILKIKQDGIDSNHRNIKKKQRGLACRADKIRTIRFQDGIVTDHQLNKKIQLKKYLRGDLSGLR